MYKHSSFNRYCIQLCIKFIDYSKDLIVLTSDSGCLTILEFDLDSFEFRSLANYKIGNAGCGKNVPGQYLQISPDNRFIAVCIYYSNWY